MSTYGKIVKRSRRITTCFSENKHTSIYNLFETRRSTRLAKNSINTDNRTEDQRNQSDVYVTDDITISTNTTSTETIISSVTSVLNYIVVDETEDIISCDEQFNPLLSTPLSNTTSASLSSTTSTTLSADTTSVTSSSNTASSLSPIRSAVSSPKQTDKFYHGLKNTRPFNDYLKQCYELNKLSNLSSNKTTTKPVSFNISDEFVTIGHDSLEDCKLFIQDCKANPINIKAINSDANTITKMKNSAIQLGIPESNINQTTMYQFLNEKNTLHKILYLDYCGTLNGRRAHKKNDIAVRPAIDVINAINKAADNAVIGITYAMRNNKAVSFPAHGISSSEELRDKFIMLLKRVSTYFGKYLEFPTNYSMSYSNSVNKSQPMGLLIFHVHDVCMSRRSAYKLAKKDALAYINWADTCSTVEAYRRNIW
jgi:hypothetical protein